ncbi:MAG: hypothetical protein QOD45_1225 [Pseudonocardiales bacterium]|nr:hypothetical protein [Pseudonocardiales bacterium]
MTLCWPELQNVIETGFDVDALELPPAPLDVELA